MNGTASRLSGVKRWCARQFVTSGYFGALPGDPDGGKTRVITQNRVGPTFWVGSQSNGGPFSAHWDKLGAIGHYDYGSLTMARTLGGDANQVAVAGRKVLIGWIGGAVTASQSLARDLSLSSGYELLQQFVRRSRFEPKQPSACHCRAASSAARLRISPMPGTRAQDAARCAHTHDDS